MSKSTVEKIPKSDTSVIVADTKSINRHLKILDGIFEAYRKNYFFAIGFGLYWFDDTGAYQQIGSKTYSTIADFAKDRYGLSRATTYQYLAVIKKFGRINPDTGEIDAIKDEYKDYGSTALIIMSGMTDEQLAECRPDMKNKELKAIRDGLPLEEKDGKDPEPEKKGCAQPNSGSPKNSQKLYEFKNVVDFESHSKEVIENIKKILKQNEDNEFYFYRINISMTFE